MIKKLIVSSCFSYLFLVVLATHAEVLSNITQQELNKQLIQAIIENDNSSVRDLLKRDAHPNYNEGWPLYLASGYGHKDTIEILISSGADPNIQWHGFGTPIFIAIVSGHLEVIQTLLEGGANPNIQNMNPDFDT